MQQCGFCSMLSGVVRRAMCIGSRRGSSESYYRELGDQDTLKIEDKSSDLSEDSDEVKEPDCQLDQEEGSVVEPLRVGQRGPHTGRFLTMHKRRKKRLLTRTLCNEAALLDDLQLGQVQCILDRSVQWKFNAFTLENVSGGRCLPVLCIHLFHVHGLLTHFRLDVAKAWKLFSLIEEGYHSTNPYHNSIHAADVTQAMHCFLQQKRIRDHLEPLEVLASLLAAIAHDIDHPGVNQPFLIATSNHLAALYRNTSVLENHHWRSAISCLMESGLLDQVPGLRPQLQHQISSLILATDITRQQEYLSQFKGHLDSGTLELRTAEHRHLVLQIALKCADISNPCRPWEISRKWSLKVCEEFFRQGDYERKLNLPVTALCDRHTTSIPKIQTGFFEFVVTPLISEWHRFLQNDLSSQMLRNLRYNQGQWDQLLAEELAEETGTEISDAELAADDLEACSDNISESSELLLPRRSSLTPAKQRGFKEQLRRLSVPLNVFQDTKFKNRGQTSSNASEARGSEHSLHSQLSVRGQCTAGGERAISAEKLLPDCSIASLTTPRQATRLAALAEPARLLRQQTFPPPDSGRAAALTARPLHASNDDAVYPRQTKTEIGQKLLEGRISNVFKKTDHDDASENNNVDVTESPRNVEKENRDPCPPRRESAPVGSQLRDNMAASLPLQPDHLLRRKSMPTDTITYAPKEKLRDVTSALPALLRRTVSGAERWRRRRGSAPAPGAAARRKPGPIASCQQWLAKATYSVQERTHYLPRRSSLPVEVLTDYYPNWLDDAQDRNELKHAMIGTTSDGDTGYFYLRLKFLDRDADTVRKERQKNIIWTQL